MKKKSKKRARGTSSRGTTTAKKTKPPAKGNKTKSGTAATKETSSDHTLKATLVGIDGGNHDMGNVLVPSYMLGADTDITDLCIKAVLTTNTGSQPDPIARNYTTYWGREL